MSRRGIRSVDGRLAHDGPQLLLLTCQRCGCRQSASGMVPRVGGDEPGVPLCFGCYERLTGGEWHDWDEYWDGENWIPLREGA